MNKKKLGKKMSKAFWGYFFIAPTLIGVLILNIWSVIQTIYFSLNEVKGFNSPKFIGFENYQRLFSDSEMFRTLGNTFKYALITVPIGVFLSLLVAVMLNTKIRGKNAFRGIYFLPVITAPTAVALVWKWLYNNQYGLINYVLRLFGLNGVDWLGNRNIALVSIAIVGIWSMIGYNMVILLAGLQEVPQTLQEAANIDGAGPVTRLFKITIPLVSPTLFFVTVTTTISSLQVFDHIYMMLEPKSPAYKHVQSVVALFFRYTFSNYNKGYGSAIIAVLLVIILAITLIQMALQKKLVHYD